ncbi:hypothetical protein HY946_02840 [Candidatus Gottesmanbacteria bacterium]|nr:hypothetical protein [Candidatus Gottesmanbacteria bacterium]
MKKPALILVSVLFIVILGGIFLFKDRIFPKKEELAPTPTPSAHFTLPEQKEERIEVDLTPRYDKKAVILKISKIPTDVTSIDYELSYEAKGGLPRGVLGKVDIKAGQQTILREILLGTCSRNVCVYDEGVKKVSLTLKFNKSSGQSTGFNQEYEL